MTKMLLGIINKYSEVLLYVFFGFLSFVVNILVFIILTDLLHLNEHYSNIVAWIVTVSFAYFCNRQWVFKSQKRKVSEIIKEVVSFFEGRIVTLIIEEIIIYIFITRMHLDSHIIKMAAQVIVIVINYVISKIWVFREDKM